MAEEPTIEVKDLKLQSTWTFWYDKKENQDKKPTAAKKTTSKEWKSKLKQVGSFDSVLSFWRYYSWMKTPSQLTPGMNLYVFREDLEPMWETFPKGGCWIIRFHKANSQNGIIDRVWEELLLAIVGEQFRTPELVGVSLSRRQNHKTVSHILSIWNKNTEDKPSAKFRIGERLKVLLHLAAESTIEYKLFNKAITDNSTFRNAQPYTYVPV